MALSVGLTYDLRDDYIKAGLSEADSAEFDSEETIAALQASLQKLGYDVQRIGAVKALITRLAAGQRWDLVFNIAEGCFGRCREAQVPALLEAFQIPYTFSDPLVCALTLDKALAKQFVSAAGLHTPAFVAASSLQDVFELQLPFPLFAKPNAEGTSKGIDGRAVVSDRQQLIEVCTELLTTFGPPVLIEEFLPGREFTVGVLGNGENARVLGVMEIHVLSDDQRVYSFESKELWEERVRYSDPPDSPLKRAVEALALSAYAVLQCRDAGRVDIRLDAEGIPQFLELNPLPGLHPTHSDLPMIATRQSISYDDLIADIVNEAWRRYSSSWQEQVKRHERLATADVRPAIA